MASASLERGRNACVTLLVNLILRLQLAAPELAPGFIVTSNMQAVNSFDKKKFGIISDFLKINRY